MKFNLESLNTMPFIKKQIEVKRNKNIEKKC